MKYWFNTSLQPDGTLSPEMWVMTEATSEQEALHLACDTLTLNQLPTTIHVSNDKFLHTNGTPMITHAFQLEVTL